MSRRVLPCADADAPSYTNMPCEAVPSTVLSFKTAETRDPLTEMPRRPEDSTTLRSTRAVIDSPSRDSTMMPCEADPDIWLSHTRTEPTPFTLTPGACSISGLQMTWLPTNDESSNPYIDTAYDSIELKAQFVTTIRSASMETASVVPSAL